MRFWVFTRVHIKLLLLTSLMGLTNCTPDEVCFTDNGTRVKIDFKRVFYRDTDSAFLENDTLIVFQISAVDTDSVFVEIDTLSSVVLPVNTGTDGTTFVFDTNQAVHTLELGYDRVQRLISVECGPEQIIENLEWVATTFDSLAIIRPQLFQEPQTNVEVYR